MSSDDPAPTFRHDPVMVGKIVDLLGVVPDGVLLDATLGGAGHALALLRAHPGLELVGLDQDPDALRAATAALADVSARAALVHARFDALGEVLDERLAGRPLTAVLFDLGVSSHQLDEADRGFSYRLDAPLDMRMDPSQPTSAADIVNGATERELTRMLRRNADERYADRIARAIVSARPLRRTGELAEVVRGAIPAAARRRGGHPAKRTFQAIRIAVNGELDILPGALDDAIARLAAGGRIAVLSYHSGEDRIVKERLLQAETGGCVCPPGLPCVCGAVPLVRLLRRGGWTPDAGERGANRRAESARLRAAERLPSDDAGRSTGGVRR
jgi:16S rRNA (cytosine1402-N4)-methyltransferase